MYVFRGIERGPTFAATRHLGGVEHRAMLADSFFHQAIKQVVLTPEEKAWERGLAVVCVATVHHAHVVSCVFLVFFWFLWFLWFLSFNSCLFLSPVR